VTYNKINTFRWFKENTYYLDDSYDPHNRIEAFKKATENGRFPLGILYVNPKPTFDEKLNVYKESKEPLFSRKRDIQKLAELIESRKGF